MCYGFNMELLINILRFWVVLFLTSAYAWGSVPATTVNIFQQAIPDCDEYLQELRENDFVYDWLTVPESFGNQQIKVFYYYRAPLLNNVVLFHNGGPASDSHGSYGIFDDKLKQYNLGEKISFVFMDQRGTGCSSPYPQGSTPEILKRLQAYGSRNIVEDSEALRKVLLGENKPWKVFGQSFGAYIVHRYAAMYPESLVKAYAHAGTIISDPIQRLAMRIFSQHRVLNVYLKKYPKDIPLIHTLNLALSDSTYCVENLDHKLICGHAIIEPLISLLAFSQKWARLHDLLNSMVRISPLTNTYSLSKKDLISFVNKYKSREVLNSVSASNQSPAAWAIAILNAYDRNVISPEFESCTLAHQMIKKNYQVSPNQILLSECLVPLQFKIFSEHNAVANSVISGKQDFLTLPDFKIGLTKMTPGSFRLYSGERDCFVPRESFAEELTAAGSLLTATHFEFSGHEGFATEAQIWSDLADESL